MMPGFSSGLGGLADPRTLTGPIDIRGCDTGKLIEQMKVMLVIRCVEEKIGEMVTAGRIVCPCHLGIGQEAVAVGVSAHLRNSDRVFGAHRSHSHLLALGGDIYSLLAEVLGREEGCSRGMGGSMHLTSAQHGFHGSVPIVAGTVPLAVGAALAARKDGSGDIAVAYFGDGAAEEGAVHESLNLAAAWEAPVLFVCENNLFASHMHISLRQPSDDIARYAKAHHIPAETVDGNDLVAVSAAVGRLVRSMRQGGGPGFLEAVTYRWRGHVGPSEDNDVGVNRGSDLALWKKRDPVNRLLTSLREFGALDDAAFNLMEGTVRREVDAAWQKAEAAPFPPPSALLDLVYARVG